MWLTPDPVDRAGDGCTRKGLAMKRRGDGRTCRRARSSGEDVRCAMKVVADVRIVDVARNHLAPAAGAAAGTARTRCRTAHVRPPAARLVNRPTGADPEQPAAPPAADVPASSTSGGWCRDRRGLALAHPGRWFGDSATDIAAGLLRRWIADVAQLTLVPSGSECQPVVACRPGEKQCPGPTCKVSATVASWSTVAQEAALSN